MPVPMVAPMPNIESWKSPMVRASSLLSLSAPVSAVISGTGFLRNSCCVNDDAMTASPGGRTPEE